MIRKIKTLKGMEMRTESQEAYDDFLTMTSLVEAAVPPATNGAYTEGDLCAILVKEGESVPGRRGRKVLQTVALVYAAS